MQFKFSTEEKTMFDKRKSNQDLGSVGFRQRLEEDRISQLPDSLICQILSHLPAKDSVKTSVLSTRWRSLWLWVPCLELKSTDFPDLSAYMSFGNKFFDCDRVSCIDSLEIFNVDGFGVDDDTSRFTSWVDAAAKRKVQHLLVVCSPKTSCKMPVSLYVCETLVSLKLSNVILDDAQFVSFPCLKTMNLSFVWFSNDATYEKLVSCCPVLENLQNFRCLNVPQVYRVHSRSLKRLSIVRCSSSQVDSVPGVVIDAPRLWDLTIADNVLKSVIVNNLESNAKLNISLSFGLEGFDEASISSGRSHIRSFLAGISKVGDMTICPRTVQVLHHYSKTESLPQFGYMSHLFLIAPNLKWLMATFLKKCPNLKSLVLLHSGNYYQELHCEEMNQISFSSVPKCLLSSLEFVDFKFSSSGLVAEMMLVSYFLENSAVLQKLTLHLGSHSTNDEICKKLIEFPRASNKCEVVIVKM